jgi:hypothetical protein
MKGSGTVFKLSVLFAMLVGAAGRLPAAELKAETSRAWGAYVRATESRVRSELSSQKGFLALDFQPRQKALAERNEIRAGEVPVTRMESLDENGKRISVPSGMIHHWRGSIFIPGVDLDFVLRRIENPESHDLRQEDVLRSAVLDRRDGYLRIYLKLQRSKIVTVVYNTEHDVRYKRLGGGRAWSSSKAVKIAELEKPNSPDESEKPEGRDLGFLWRLNSYWRYEQVEGGVIVECESISLSRSIPSMLELIVRPIIYSVARESMERTLTSLRGRLLACPAETGRVAMNTRRRGGSCCPPYERAVRTAKPYERSSEQSS